MSLRQLAYKSLVKRSVAGFARNSSPMIISRFESTSTNTGAKVEKSNKELTSANNQVNKPNRPNRNGLRSRRNPKLIEIRDQIEKVISSAGNDLTESLDIFEEGLSYLRDIQATENIDDELVYKTFRNLGTKLLDKAVDTNAALGAQTVQGVLDILIQYNVAHNVNFFQAMSHELINSGGGETAYENILQIWVKYLEYKKFVLNGNDVDVFFYHLKDRYYNKYLIKDLAYYAYCQSCISGKLEYNFNDVTKLLQSEEVPQVYLVKKTIGQIKTTDKATLQRNLFKFQEEINQISLGNLDPNGIQVLKKIESSVIYKDVNQLNTLYDQIKLSSQNNQVSLKESTLFKLMSSYYELELFNNVFRVFQDMQASGIELPHISIWEILIRSMGHPGFIETLPKSERRKWSENIERVVATCIEKETKISSKTLSVIVSSFANLNDFEKVDSYLEKFKDVPMIHTTRNNILVGLIINKKIDEAESKLNQYMSEDKTYRPNSKVMNSFLAHHAKNNNLDAVNGIIKFMEKNDIPEEVATLTIIIGLYFKINLKKGQQPNVSDILELFKNSQIKFNYFTYTVLIDGLIKDGGNIEAARGVFEHLSKQFKQKPSAQILTSMIKGELEYGFTGNAEDLFSKYIKEIKNETRMWNLMVSSLLSRDEGLAVDYYNKLKGQLNHGVEPNFYTYYFMLNHFMKKGNRAMIEMILNDLNNSNLKDLGKSLPKMIKRLSQDYAVPSALLSKI